MNAFSIVAAAGLVLLVFGVFLVNVVSTPRTALAGTVVTGFGVLLLAISAVERLL